jgi:hypothetical protein
MKIENQPKQKTQLLFHSVSIISYLNEKNLRLQKLPSPVNKKSAFVCVSIIRIILELPTSRCFFDEPGSRKRKSGGESIPDK